MNYIIAGVTSLLGKEIVKKLLLSNRVRRILGFSRNEYIQWRMQLELDEFFPDWRNKLEFKLCDIRNYDLLDTMIYRFSNNYTTSTQVINLASLKHVDYAEDNRAEYRSVNTLGTENLCKISRDFVYPMISLTSDKACYPAGVYGNTKLDQEKTVLEYGGQVIRPGNFITSHGNIVEKLRRSNPKITCTGMTRFYIQIKDLAERIITLPDESGIYAMKSKSAKLGDIVEAIKPDLCTIETKKFRRGEKMHEHLITKNDYPVWEFDNYYLVGEDRDIHKDRPKMNKGFEYTSKDNKDWWTVEEIKTW